MYIWIYPLITTAPMLRFKTSNVFRRQEEHLSKKDPMQMKLRMGIIILRKTLETS